MPQAQPVNSSQIDGLSSQFQRRWEPGYHWRSMCSMLLGTPGLRAAWPMSVVDFQLPACKDISGHGYDLTPPGALGNVHFGHDTVGIAPIAVFGGAANQYLSRASAVGNWGTITGTEVNIIAAQRGLTVGGWFFGTTTGGNMRLMAKDDSGANRQYVLVWPAVGFAQFIVWPGAVIVQSANAVNSPGWNHITGIYDQPSQTVFVELNGVITAGGAGAAPAVLADTAAPFTIGADGAGGNRFTGWGSDCFLSAVSLSQGFVRAGYHYTKAAFGVK